MTTLSTAQLAGIQNHSLKGIIFDGASDVILANQEYDDNGLILLTDGTNVASAQNVDFIVFNGPAEIAEFGDRALYADLTSGTSFVMTAVLLSVEGQAFD